MQILQNFKHNPKINTIFISKVSVACSSPGAWGQLGDFWAVHRGLLKDHHASVSIPVCPVSRDTGMLFGGEYKKQT